jgi:hypothetical protein
MDHGMAVGTNWAQISNWIDADSFAHRPEQRQMMNVNQADDLRAVLIGQRSPANHTGRAVMLDATLSSQRVTFVSIHLHPDGRALLEFGT